MLRLPPFDKIGVNPPPEFQNADPANGVAGSIVNGLVFNQLQHEGENLELLAGLTPSGTDLTQWAQAVSRGIWAGNLTGTGDLAVATLGVVIPDLLQGMRLGAIATATNTVTNPKLRVTNKGTQGGYTDYPILKADGTALAAGDIKAGRIYRFEADGAGNVLISGGGISGAGAGSGTLIGVQKFTASGTYTPTAGATRAVAIGTGGGGGGGGAYNSQAAAGGGAGSTAIAFLSSLSAMAVTIGGGGTPGTGNASGSTNNGTAGGTTSLGSVLSAGGGQPSSNFPGGGYYGTTGGNGGTATTGTLLITGGSGDTVTSFNGGSGGQYGIVGGSGGASFWGGGGAGSYSGSATLPTGQNGQAYGSGGGGTSSGTTAGSTGGNGAPGVLIVLEFA